MRKTITFIILISNYVICQSQDFKTLTYFSNDSVKLDLDLFLPKTTVYSKTPLFIYVHGGGFSAGNRNVGHPICRFLAERGFATASISYTLYMKNKDFSCKCASSEKIKAVQLAVNDLWQATLFVIKNKERYNIDASKIFIGGSSAGGTTVLHAAYWKPSKMNIYQERLPDSFRYAGLISGSGAISDTNLITTKNLIPTMLFHGTCDALVPYASAPHHYCPKGTPGWLMLYGSYTLYNQILAMDGSTYLVTYCGGSHAYHNKLFVNDQLKISGFIEKVVKSEKIQEHQIIQTGVKCKRSLEYKICD